MNLVTLPKPDNNATNNNDTSTVTVLGRDVAVNITAPPESVLVGTPFNYTVNM
jgi:hypothetical protein